MKKVLLISGALLALTATIASAQGGINLSWNDCGAFGSAQRNFACGTNSGTNVMVASIITPVPMPQLTGQAGVVDLQSNQATLGAWWDFNTCRATPVALSGNFNFTVNTNCLDPWGGVAAGGINYQYQFNAPNRGRIRTICAVFPATSSDGASEYYMFGVAFNNSKTTGTGSCAGCSDGACIVLNSVQVTQPPGVGDFVVSNPLLRNFIGWQAGASGVGVGPYGGTGCPGATPTRNSTWGSVKSLYR